MLSATDGSATTSGTATVYVTGDGGTQSTGAGTATHEGNGCWSYAPTQAETNHGHISFTMVISGSINQTVNVYTGVNVTLIEDADATDQVNAACDTALSDYDGPTNAEMIARTLPTADYFDPSADVVDNVNFVSSVVNPVVASEVVAAVTTDAASRTASQADVSDLITGSILTPGHYPQITILTFLRIQYQRILFRSAATVQQPII